MEMLCKVAAGFSDVRCPVCGQGFLVYWTRTRGTDRAERRHSLQLALRAHHGALEGTEAHPPAFSMPEAPAALPQRLPEPVLGGPLPLYN